jgi:hypothetical protein
MKPTSSFSAESTASTATGPTSTPASPASPASPALLDAVLAHSSPQLGQIVLGRLMSLEPAWAEVPQLGRVPLGGSLVPLSPADLLRPVALSLLADGQALLLGRLWEAGAQTLPVQIAADGLPKSHVIEAQQSLSLRCGEASIDLHADGRIQLRGTYITSHATATQRLVGGSVHVN